MEVIISDFVDQLIDLYDTVALLKANDEEREYIEIQSYTSKSSV